jgi:hypothetical protein
MRKFVKKILLFLSPLILGAYFLDVFISKTLKKSVSYGRKEFPTWNLLLKGQLNSEIVIYGSSRACLQIDPVMITDSLHVTAYNLGINGHNFWLQYLRHQLLLKNGSQPKLIIHAVDVATLEKRKDLYNAEQFLPYMLNNDVIQNATINYLGYSFIDYKIPLVRYLGKPDAFAAVIRTLANPQGSSVTGKIKGYEPQDISWNEDFDKAIRKMKFYEAILDTPTINLFELYLKECNTKKIKLIFVYTPEYIDGQNFIKNRDKIIAIYKILGKKYNIPFYDYSDDSISVIKKYYYNSMHLNKTGAEIFTNEIIEKLKAIPLK